jgi:hypothetical protein
MNKLISIDLGTIEYYNGNEFVYEIGGIVRFEYTLKVVYDWEAKWRKPFLKGGLTDEETIDFYMRMALDPLKESFLTTDITSILAEYIADQSTATTFSEEGPDGKPKSTNRKIYTSEELYALMFEAQVPLEWENRNLNRLMTILRIISIHNNPPKKMSNEEILRQNRELNAKRRELLKTRG